MKYFSYIGLSIALVGCTPPPASHPPYNATVSWPTREIALTAITTWTAEGAVSIRTPQHADAASVTWLQSPGQYTLAFYGPLGIGGATLEGTSTNVTLTEDNGTRLTASTPEALVEKALGWPLPVTPLYYWIRGLPAPGATNAQSFDRYNHLTHLQQGGWHIDYLQYTGVSSLDLPSLITLTRPGWVIRITVHQWSLNSPESITKNAAYQNHPVN